MFIYFSSQYKIKIIPIFLFFIIIFNSRKMTQIKLALAELNHRSELMFCVSHHRIDPIHLLFSTQQQRKFFQFVIDNLKYPNISCSTFQDFLSVEAENKEAIIVIMDIPHSFEEMKSLLASSIQYKEVILFVPSLFKKYVNLLKKKVTNDLGCQLLLTQHSTAKFIGINDKIKEFVDSNYDMNRAGFYAYGSYLNSIHKNPIKKIFRTEVINVDKLSRSFGFSIAPRVNTGKFLKLNIQSEYKKEKRKQKRLNRKKRKQEEKVEEEKEVKKVKRVKKIKKMNVS